MLFFLILGLVIGGISVVFALQNVVSISVNFLAWQLQGSLALILLLAMATGILFCLVLAIPEVIRNSAQFLALRKEIKRLEEDNANYKKIIDAETASKAIATKITETHNPNSPI